MRKITSERKEEILGHTLDWFSEHFESKELLDILHEHLDMTDEEIDYFGFDFSDLEQDNRFSVFCMKDYEDSVFFTTAIPNDLYCAASTYHYYIKDDVGRDSLDSLAGCFSDQQFIDEQVFSVLCSAMSRTSRIASLIEFDFDSNQLRYCDGANDMWQTYDLQDISEAVVKSNADNTLNYSARKNIFLENLERKEIFIDPDEEILNEYGIERYGDVNEAFDKYYGEDETREDIIALLSEEMKEQILNSCFNLRCINGIYYCGYNFGPFFEALNNAEAEPTESESESPSMSM